MELLLLGALALVVIALLVASSRRASVVTVDDSLRLPRDRAAVERDSFGPLGAIPQATMATAVPGQVTLTTRWTPTWTVVVGILSFPVGMLLVLLVRQTLTLHVRYLEDGDGTLVQVAGRTRRSVARSVGEVLESQRRQVAESA